MDIKYYSKCAVIGILTGILNGLFGAGGGVIVVPAMIYLLNTEPHKAHASAISIILPLTIVSSLFYIFNNYVEWGLVYKTSIGGIFGGLLGAIFLKSIPDNYLRKIFGCFMILASFRMVFY